MLFAAFSSRSPPPAVSVTEVAPAIVSASDLASSETAEPSAVSCVAAARERGPEERAATMGASTVATRAEVRDSAPPAEAVSGTPVGAVSASTVPPAVTSTGPPEASERKVPP